MTETTFILKRFNRKRGKVQCYHWQAENPCAVMCIIHGAGEHAKRYRRMIRALIKANISVTSIDLRGHGRSSGTRGGCAPRDSILEDIDELIGYSHLCYPDVPLFLYGHSIGGNIVLDYKKRGKMNCMPAGYIVSSPWVILSRKVPSWLPPSVKIVSKVWPDFVMRTKVPDNILGHKKNIMDYKKDPLGHSKITAQAAIEGYTVAEKLYKGTLEDNGKADEIPMLLMHGTDDSICKIEGSRRIAELEGPGCTYVEWPGLRHEIHNGGSESTGEEVLEKIIDWIKGFEE